MQAGSLNCPNCGAAVSKDAAQCQYCHALLQTVACPKCMGMMFIGTRFCPHCGAPATPVAVGEKTNKSCPRCHTALRQAQVANIPLEECPDCGGLWMPIASFDNICSDAQARTIATGWKLPPPPPVDIHVKYLHCPQCGNLMGRVNYCDGSGIVTNVCRPHGIWLAPGQLQQIVNFIHAGGIEQARFVKQRKLEELQRELESGRPMRGISEGDGATFNP